MCRMSSLVRLVEDPTYGGEALVSGLVRGPDIACAVGETLTLLHPSSAFSRCFNTDKQGVSAKWQNSRRRLMSPQCSASGPIVPGLPA